MKRHESHTFHGGTSRVKYKPDEETYAARQLREFREGPPKPTHEQCVTAPGVNVAREVYAFTSTSGRRETRAEREANKSF